MGALESGNEIGAKLEYRFTRAIDDGRAILSLQSISVSIAHRLCKGIKS